MEGVIDILQAVRKEQEETLSILDSLMPNSVPVKVHKDTDGALERMRALTEVVRIQAAYIQTRVSRIQIAIQGDHPDADLARYAGDGIIHRSTS